MRLDHLAVAAVVLGTASLGSAAAGVTGIAGSLPVAASTSSSTVSTSLIGGHHRGRTHDEQDGGHEGGHLDRRDL